jgi:hypothetical protein
LLLWAVPRPPEGLTKAAKAAAAKEAARTYATKFREVAQLLPWGGPRQATITLEAYTAFLRRWLAAERAAATGETRQVGFWCRVSGRAWAREVQASMLLGGCPGSNISNVSNIKQVLVALRPLSSNQNLRNFELWAAGHPHDSVESARVYKLQIWYRRNHAICDVDGNTSTAMWGAFAGGEGQRGGSSECGVGGAAGGDAEHRSGICGGVCLRLSCSAGCITRGWPPRGTSNSAGPDACLLWQVKTCSLLSFFLAFSGSHPSVFWNVKACSLLTLCLVLLQALTFASSSM